MDTVLPLIDSFIPHTNAENHALPVRGEASPVIISFKDSAGNPIDISNHELWFTLKADVTDLDENAILQKKIRTV